MHWVEKFHQQTALQKAYHLCLPFFDAIIAAMKSINILVVIALEIHDYMNTHARLNCLNHCYYYRYFADTPYEHMSE